jgi:hypothetical protein
VIAEDPKDDRLHENPRESLGRPGTRAPHYWLQRAGGQISTLDLFGKNFVLLTGPGGDAWWKAARPEDLGAPVDSHKIGGNGLSDPSGGFTEAYGMNPDGAVLVRPDGFVAWRAKTGDGASPGAIQQVLEKVLFRGGTRR